MRDSKMPRVMDGSAAERHEFRRPAFLFLMLCHTVLLLIAEGGCHATLENEVFSEDLLLRPLSDGKVLAHFYFKNTLRTLGSAAHHHVFPKAISQLVQKFHIKEMELSFTQGRWNYERWGALDPIASSNAKPLGVELWATFDVPLDQVDATWRNLTHALSGLFCASINFLEAPATMAAPEFSFGQDFSTVGNLGDHRFASTTSRKRQGTSGWLRYGALPRESVCTENLTPWLKLLPCRDKAGISTLLDRPSIYRGYYHSLRVQLRSGSPGIGGTVLEQTLTLVLQPAQTRERSSGKDMPNWSLSSVFGRHLEGRCPLAKTSHVLLELEGFLVEKAEGLNRRKRRTGLLDEISDTLRGEDFRDAKAQLRDEINILENVAFSLTPYPNLFFQETRDPEVHGHVTHPSVLLDYWLQNYSKAQPLDLGILWKEQVSWPSYRGPFRVSRFLVGSGNQKGSIVVELKSNFDQTLQKQLVDNSLRQSDKSSLNSNHHVVMMFHLVPWYVRLYTYTLTALVDGYIVPLWEISTQMRIIPAEDRLSPAVLEFELQLPANISMLSLSVQFDKGFLHINEHPPDANRGFDLPSAFISFPRTQTRRHYTASQTAAMHDLSPFLHTLQGAGSVHIYSESLLVPLATPDFSMPYNVITFTCTVLALYFGSLLNTLRRRIGEEERRLAKATDSQQKGKLSQFISRYMEVKSVTQKTFAKLFGIVIVVAIAVAANHFLDLA